MFLKKLKLNAMKDYDMSNISCLSKEISNLDLKIELNNQTIEAMQQAVHAIDTDSVKLFYKYLRHRNVDIRTGVQAA